MDKLKKVKTLNNQRTIKQWNKKEQTFRTKKLTNKLTKSRNRQWMKQTSKNKQKEEQKKQTIEQKRKQ